MKSFIGWYFTGWWMTGAGTVFGVGFSLTARTPFHEGLGMAYLLAAMVFSTIFFAGVLLNDLHTNRRAYRRDLLTL